MVSISVSEFLDYYQQNGKYSSVVNSSDFEPSKIINSILPTTTVNQTEEPSGLNMADIELDVDNIPSRLPQMDEKKYTEYLEFKKIHHENFLREMNDRGLISTNNDNQHQSQPSKPLNY